MVNWTLFMVLILPAMVRLHREEIPEETIRRERGVASVCRNDTMSIIILIVCKIRTERRRGGNCSLFYRDGREFENECDSRFRLTIKNETVFIQWEDLTPEDHGNISCECSQTSGTVTLQLSVRLDENEADSSEILEPLFPLIGRILVIIITAAIFGLVYRRLRHKVCSRSAADGDDREDAYSNLQQPTSDLYQTITTTQQQHNSEAFP